MYYYTYLLLHDFKSTYYASRRIEVELIHPRLECQYW